MPIFTPATFSPQLTIMCDPSPRIRTKSRHFNLNVTSAYWPNLCLSPGDLIDGQNGARGVYIARCYSDEWYRFDYFR